MIRIRLVRSWNFLWRFSFFRWSCFHGPVGLTNYGVAFVLFWLYEVDKYTATTAGHVIHVFFGFFYDRAITFQKVVEARFWTWVRYWLVELLSYLSILLILFVLITVLEFNLCGFSLSGFDLCGQETAVTVVRVGPAMVAASLIAFFGHKHWTFTQTNSRN